MQPEPSSTPRPTRINMPDKKPPVLGGTKSQPRPTSKPTRIRPIVPNIFHTPD